MSAARRGEVPFVATRVGRSNDAKECLAMAAELKIARPHALGLITLWEEMVLSVGDAMTGEVRGYTAAHVAVQLGWTGNPARLVAALKRAGLFKSHRGTFRHPWWSESITGHYAITRAERREEDAERKRAARALLRNGTSDGRPQDNTGRPSDSDRNPDINQGRTSDGRPPQPPADAGGDLGASRWEWLKENHRRPTNPRACMPILAHMSDEDWALLQWVTTLPPDGGPYKLSRKKRVLGLDTHQILHKSAYLQLRREWQEKLRADQRPKTAGPAKVAPPPDEAAESARRLADATKYVLEALNDPEADEKAKAKAKKLFRDNYPDAHPPWESAPEYLPPQETPN